MRSTCSGSLSSTELLGQAIPDALKAQQHITGFDQAAYSKARVLFIGAGGLISHMAPTMVRKGIGSVMVLDDDTVEPSNLNRQLFYRRDIGKNKAVSLARNLVCECTAGTEIIGQGLRFEEALEHGLDLTCDLAVCGVDNNLCRVAASRYFRQHATALILTAVSADADHGYVFVQQADGPCLACLFPDILNDDRFPCPGTPAIADILQAVGALTVYAADTILLGRPRFWNYRRLSLSGAAADAMAQVPVRQDCPARTLQH